MTATGLPRVQMGTSNRPLDSVLYWDSDADHMLDMDQPYQRGHVWGPTRQRNLIKSFLLGIPVPSLIINDRFKGGFTHETWGQDRRWAYAVIDGKQRVTAILAFLRSQLDVPAEWFPDDQIGTRSGVSGDRVFYDGLTVTGQRVFRTDCTIGVSEGRFASLVEEEMVFDLVNFGGVPQGESDPDA